MQRVAVTTLKQKLPLMGTLRLLKRKLVPYDDDGSNMGFCIQQGMEIFAALRDAGINVEQSSVLEFGSGWFPVIPLIFHVANTRRIVLTDIQSLMDGRTIETARKALSTRLADVAALVGISEQEAGRRLHQVPFRPDYLVPWNMAAHPAQDVDVIISRAVLEHIPQDKLARCFGEFRRILRPDGVMCHAVDLSDHWQHGDRSLSRVNFLGYEDTDWRWRLAQAGTQSFLNRLRHSDYQALMEDARFELAHVRGDVDEGSLQDLGTRVKPAGRFKHMAAEDLAVITGLYLARER